MSKIKVNEELCIGCGACESICPNVFKLEDGKSKVIASECGSCNCKDVVSSCPVNAIEVEE
jgi:ferredoxin